MSGPPASESRAVIASSEGVSAMQQTEQIATEIGPNFGPIDVWNRILVPKFLRFRTVMVEAGLSHGLKGIERLGPAPGDRVLDIGCGFGESTLALAGRVAPGGEVVGFDCCPEFLEIAAADARQRQIGNASFQVGDAQAVRFERPFDKAFSQFGVMFFQNPVAGLANIRRQLREGATVMFTTWCSVDDNPWLALAKDAALESLPRPGDDAQTCGPGPFSMASERLVRGQLQSAGYDNVEMHLSREPVCVGADLASAVAFQLALGPAGEIVREAGEAGERLRPELEQRLSAALRPYETPRGVMLDSCAWMISATARGG